MEVLGGRAKLQRRPENFEGALHSTEELESCAVFVVLYADAAVLWWYISPKPSLEYDVTNKSTVNVIAYYSTKIFTDAGYTRSQALLASFGGGAINWIFALPAIWTIDTFGRRNLLLVTFPMMSACLYWTGSCFGIQDNGLRLPLIATSIYIFMAVYSPGLGPVPFTYSAEAFPLHIRALGMASATSITWSFNFLLSFTWPMMEKSFKPSGAFYWYATWNVVGFVFTYYLLPETKALSLEELDIVFSVRNRDHVRHYSKRMGWYAKRLMGRSPDPMPPLYELENSTVGSMSGEAVK